MDRWLINAGPAWPALDLEVCDTLRLFTWLGRLPGDLCTETMRSRIFIPLTSVITVPLINACP